MIGIGVGRSVASKSKAELELELTADVPPSATGSVHDSITKLGPTPDSETALGPPDSSAELGPTGLDDTLPPVGSAYTNAETIGDDLDKTSAIRSLTEDKSVDTVSRRLPKATPATVSGTGKSRPRARRRKKGTIAPAGVTPGSQLRQYEMIRELGRGGMGQVFLARDTKLGRRVAIKFLLTQDESLTLRMMNEARATARCIHPNIIVIHEVEEYQGWPYMVLEFLEGETLSAVLKRGVLQPARAVEIMVQVVRALACAHDNQIVHRDLKPANILLSESGAVKVLDFGIAKLFQNDDSNQQPAEEKNASEASGIIETLTQDGALVGTLPYMAPEQWGGDSVDHQVDIWAVGIMLHWMLAYVHPIPGRATHERLEEAAKDLDTPLPSILSVAPQVPLPLAAIVDKCLQKRRDDRYANAQLLLDALESQLPGRAGRNLHIDESPYPGLAAFQEDDAGRFFGRDREVARAMMQLRNTPLLAVVGPSGAGKSSFVRAGVVPALKAMGENWEVLLARPGRDPVANLAGLIRPMETSRISGKEEAPDFDSLVERLSVEPGYAGKLLRKRAHARDGQILLFVDQFEELYTLASDEARATFLACLAACADDPASPLRVAVSMRSDFLDRAAGDSGFMDSLTRGLFFLSPPSVDGLREAILKPAEMAGYSFESTEVVDDMQRVLASTTGSLPLMQFAMSRVWEHRDRERKLLTVASYKAIGGVSGTLASHADELLQALSPQDQKVARSVFERLVTPERTRAIAGVNDLCSLSDRPGAVQAIIDRLVAARLLVVQTRTEDEGPAVEIVHESLITAWPTLKRWLDDNHDDLAFLSELGSAARQWQARERPAGLLWRGDTSVEAEKFRGRYTGDLSRVEIDFLEAVGAMSKRASKIRRWLTIASISLLSVLVAAAAIALVTIRSAEQSAKRQAKMAKAETQRALAAETAALAAKQEATQALNEKGEAVRQTTKAVDDRNEAELRAQAAEGEATLSKDDLRAALKSARGLREQAQKQAGRARTEAKQAGVARDRAQALLQENRRLVQAKEGEIRKLKKRLDGIVTKLR